MSLKITAARWVTVEEQLYIKYFDENMRPHLKKPKISPYFFVRLKDLSRVGKIEQFITNIEPGNFLSCPEREPCVKIEVRYPSDVRTCRDILWERGVRTWESDIPFVRRWMIDENVTVYESPKILYFDVEADARTGFPRPENPTQRILSIAAVDSDGKEYFICFKNERFIFEKFISLFKKYPILVGWASNFWDLPYLQARAKALNIDFPHRDTSWIDIMEILKYSMYKSFTSLKLDYVAQRILGKGKVISLYKSGGANQLWEWFQKDVHKLREYNMTDAILTKQIDEELGLVQGKIFLAQKARLPYHKMTTTSARVENLALIKALEKDPRPVFPYYPRPEKTSPYQGALVITPSRGVFRGVMDLDFSAMYPSIITTWNVGIDTVVKGMYSGEYIKTPLNVGFLISPRSVFADVIEDLKVARDYYKNLRDSEEYGSEKWKKYHVFQAEIKLASNSIYGVMGAEFMTKFYDRDIASAVTACGREILKKSIRICEDELGLKVLYCDTDGLFVLPPKGEKSPVEWAKKNVNWLIEEIETRLKQWILETFNIPEKYYNMTLKCDGIFEKIYFCGKKKRYIGIYPPSEKKDIDDYALADVHDVILNGRLGHIKGFEAKKYSTFPLYKSLQLKIFEILMDAETQVEIYYKVAALLRKLRNYLYSGVLDKLLIQTVTPGKRWMDYKSKPAYWEDLKKYTQTGQVRPGEAIRYVIVDRQDGREVGRIVLDDMKIPKISKKGYDHYWELILRMVERIVGFPISPENRAIIEWCSSSV